MEVTRLFDFIHYQQSQFPLSKSFGYKHKGNWTYFSTSEIIDMANKVSLGLMTKFGVKPGDKIAIVSTQNRPEWVIMDLGMMQAGAINVPVYPTISQREYAYIFNEAEVSHCFYGGDGLKEKLEQAQQNVPSLIGLFSFDEIPGARFWQECWADGNMVLVENIKNSIQPGDLATIIYTSGTTGEPKGVMLSHNNIISNIMALSKLAPIQPGDRVLSFLPLCHVFERVATYFYIYLGASIVHTGTENLGGEHGDLKAIQPHFFTTVPRLLEKIYEKIYNKGLDLTGLKRALFFWALRLTDSFELNKKYTGWNKLKRKIADRLIFSKWREALGGNVTGIITAASACPEKIIKVFCAAGIPIREAYGLSEASPGLTVNRFEENEAMFGTVGLAIEGVQVKIDASDGNYAEGEGEVIATGPNIMMGYYKKPEATAAMVKEINGERWLFTGDVGRFVTGPGGKMFLKITDRKKELLKTSGGKYVAPAPIESKFREDFLIEQIMVVGEQQKFVSALIVPAREALQDWCKHHDIEFSSFQDIINLPQVKERYQHIVDKYNPLFNHVEQIKQFRLLDTVWEPIKPDGSEGELTPTLKLKRRVILSKFAPVIQDIYAGE
jgi:long-chain acyl-CoA synthetase